MGVLNGVACRFDLNLSDFASKHKIVFDSLRQLEGMISGRINCPPKSLATMKKRFFFVHKYRPFCLMPFKSHSSSVCKCPEDILDRTETTVVAANVSFLLR
jgi:hypothetical protein